MAKVHEYPVTVNWFGGVEGNGEAVAERSQTAMTLSVPPEFKGPGEGTNPEELLTSAVASCYAITFGIISQNRKLPVIGFRVKAVGQVEQEGARHSYSDITIRPEIRLALDATDEQVRLTEEMAHRADQYCIVTNAIRDKVRVSVEPKITQG